MTTPSTTKGFPNYKRFWILNRENGWEDLGERDIRSGIWAREHGVHRFCGRVVHIGRDYDGTIFAFCPRCLEKVQEMTEQSATSDNPDTVK